MFYYLSFVDPGKFLGACVVEASDPMEAVIVTHRLGINPGGQVGIVPFPAESEWNDQIRDFIANRDRLLTRADLITLDPAIASSAEEADRARRARMN